MTKIRLTSFIVLSLAVLVSSAVTGCRPGAPEAAEIRIGVSGGQTGPAPAQVTAMIEELEHIFRYTNEVEGGIDGVKLSWRIIDNKGTPEGGMQAYRELKAGFDPLLFVFVEDYYFLGVKDQIEQAEDVVITVSAINPQSFVPPGRFFSTAIPVSDGFAGYIKWVLANWKGSGMPKIGVLYWGDVPSGQQWRIAQAWVMKQGVELVPVEYSIRAMDLKPQLLSLREAGVDHIWMLGIAPNAAVAIRDFRGLGLAGQISFTFNEYVEADTLLELVGEAAEGFYIYRSETPYSDGSRAAELYTEIWRWAAGEEKWSDNRLNLSVKMVISAAVKQAASDVGWENLDSAAVFQALTGLTSIDTLGNSVGFGFGPDKRIGVTTMKMARLTRDGTVSVSDPITLPRTFEGVDK